MKPLFVDSAVFLFAMGAAHPLREPCTAVLAAAWRAEVDVHVSAECIQEVLHHRLRRDTRPRAVADARDTMLLCSVHDMGTTVLDRMLELVAETRLRGRDAVHAGTALAAGFDHIVTPDGDFDSVPGLRRIDPRDVDEELARLR